MGMSGQNPESWVPIGQWPNVMVQLQFLKADQNYKDFRSCQWNAEILQL